MDNSGKNLSDKLADKSTGKSSGKSSGKSIDNDYPDADAVHLVLKDLLEHQSVVIAAPGFPSKLADLTLVAEDPDAAANKDKTYHPAERDGWRRMIAYARLLEARGLVTLEAGTFKERDFFERDFSYTGFRMPLTSAGRAAAVVVPAMGRIGFKAGTLCLHGVPEITPLHDEPQEPLEKGLNTENGSKPGVQNNPDNRQGANPGVQGGDNEAFMGGRCYLARFERTLGQMQPWADAEVVAASGIAELLEGEVRVKICCEDGICKPGSPRARAELEQPFLGF